MHKDTDRNRIVFDTVQENDAVQDILMTVCPLVIEPDQLLPSLEQTNRRNIQAPESHASISTVESAHFIVMARLAIELLTTQATNTLDIKPPNQSVRFGFILPSMVRRRIIERRDIKEFRRTLDTYTDLAQRIIAVEVLLKNVRSLSGNQPSSSD